MKIQEIIFKDSGDSAYLNLIFPHKIDEYKFCNTLKTHQVFATTPITCQHTTDKSAITLSSTENAFSKVWIIFWQWNTYEINATK